MEKLLNIQSFPKKSYYASKIYSELKYINTDLLWIPIGSICLAHTVLSLQTLSLPSLKQNASVTIHICILSRILDQLVPKWHPEEF